MRSASYALLAGVIFSFVAVLHILRVIFGWSVIIADYQIPAWWSILGVIFAGTFAVLGLTSQ